MTTRWDKIIIILILFISLSVYALFFSFNFGEQADSAIIYVDGKEYAKYQLSEISESKTVDISTEYGKNVVEITNKGVRMKAASCPDKLDVKSGEITKPGQVLICIPNKVYVRITGKDKSNVDKVTY